MSFDRYKEQVNLLLDVLPVVAAHPEFALKGGTALNLFYLDLPRLSVDIDLCYLPIENREQSIRHMHAGLTSIKSEIEAKLKCKVKPTKPLTGDNEVRLIVNRNGIEIKIEPNYIIRGSLFEAKVLPTTSTVTKEFKKEADVACLNLNDLYGGKICAALDRQHPRDLFDMLKFFATKTIDADVKDAFIYYLISHNRPFYGLLAPTDKDIRKVFESEFGGMTLEPVDLSDLLKARQELKTKIVSAMDANNRKLILSIAAGHPDWTLYAHPKIKRYPSVLWRLHNITKMEKTKRDAQLKSLEKIFAG